jgi:N-acylglucosamine 2-epimerase
MILANLSLEMDWMLDAETLERSLDTCLHEVLDLSLDTELMVLRENVAPDGQKLDCFEGRLIIEFRKSNGDITKVVMGALRTG